MSQGVYKELHWLTDAELAGVSYNKNAQILLICRSQSTKLTVLHFMFDTAAVDLPSDYVCNGHFTDQ